MEKRVSIGLDIGTTTISAVVLDIHSGSLLARKTVKSEADLPSVHPLEKIQDAAMIEEKVRKLLEELLRKFPEARCIGLTGQMHGIVYLDGNGKLLSPLYTWQDRQAEPYCDEIKAHSGYTVSPGYGLATVYAMKKENRIPKDAVKICTIMDYLAYSLGGKLVIHSSNAASLGFFSENGFDETALEILGIPVSFLPEVDFGCTVAGSFQGIPVAAAIGDNQASFLGSVAEQDTMALANFGTGSQISVMTEQRITGDGAIELRPLVDRTNLACGSALCGGRAYALLERFFRSYTGDNREQYPTLNALAEKGLQMEHLPTVLPTFCGTRADPNIRGSILQLGEDNFTPAALAAGLLLGMARELKEMFAKMPAQEIKALVASGNGIRKNPALVKALERVFGMPVQIPAHQEEAAFGAALYASAATGESDLAEVRRRCIHYIS